MLDLLMEQGLKIEGGDMLGKTIIFARNHDHAVFIEKCFNGRYPKYGGKLMRIIDNQTKFAQQAIDEFSQRDNTEFMIAVSVDMLDTGIDIPEVLNLVFFKPVMSKAKFWQMVGRGTRLCKDLFGPGEDKQFFQIFDVCGNIEFFSATDIREIPAAVTGTLSQQIFSAKVDIVFLIQKNTATDEDKAVAAAYADELHNIVEALNQNDFRVQMHMRYVVKYRDRSIWSSLRQSDVVDIHRELSPLYLDELSAELTRRFDLMVLKLIRSRLESGNSGFYINKVKALVEGLQRKMNLPDVKRQEHLIIRVLEDEYWSKATIAEIEKMRQDLRGLMQYVEKNEKIVLYTDFNDEMRLVEEADLFTEYTNLDAYKKRVEAFIRENQHHVTIHRIRNNVPITKAELSELEKLLFSFGQNGNKEKLEKIINGQPLGKFIRSILGLDINAAKAAFADFLNDANLSSVQIHFINTLIDYLCQNGTIDKEMLFDKPFTNIDDQGIIGVFPDKAGKIISIIDEINANAMQVA